MSKQKHIQWLVLGLVSALCVITVSARPVPLPGEVENPRCTLNNHYPGCVHEGPRKDWCKVIYEEHIAPLGPHGIFWVPVIGSAATAVVVCRKAPKHLAVQLVCNITVGAAAAACLSQWQI